MMKRLRTACLAAGLLGLTAPLAAAKSPDLPAAPAVEFKVLPATGQEYFEPDAASANPVFVHTGIARVPARPAGAVAGLAGLALMWTDAANDRTSAADALAGLQVYSLFQTGYDRLAADVFAMAEAHEKAGDWEEARRWYGGLRSLFPASAYALTAAKRMEQVVLLRVLAEAGEEQSEEPPVAPAMPEPLNVVPREVKP